MVKVLVRVFGNTMDSHTKFLDNVMCSPKICRVKSEEESDVMIAFVPIVSRAGTDIEAALQEIPEAQRVILVVLHHTFDSECHVPDSRVTINRRNVVAVDCLFHEDQGLLTCVRNDDALEEVKKYLKAEDSSPESRSSENESLPLVAKPFLENKKMCLVIGVVVLVILIVVVIVVTPK